MDEETRRALGSVSHALIVEAEESLRQRDMLDLDIDSLSDDERRELDETEILALSWQQHLRIYPEWEAYREEGEHEGMNPRLHVAVHCIVERRVLEPDWPYREEFEKMLRDGASRHDAIHELGVDVAREIWEALRGESE
jgi:hypothetical protein